MNPIESTILLIGYALFVGMAVTPFVLEMRSLYFGNHNQSSYPTVNENKPDTLTELSDPHATHAFLNRHGAPFDPAYTPPYDIVQAGATTVEITRDGNQWCALIGTDLQDGVAGFGDTIANALHALANDPSLLNYCNT